MSPTEDGRQLMRAGEVATLLNLDRKEVYRMLERGDIPRIKIGRSVRIAPADLDTYLEKQRS